MVRRWPTSAPPDHPVGVRLRLEMPAKGASEGASGNSADPAAPFDLVDDSSSRFLAGASECTPHSCQPAALNISSMVAPFALQHRHQRLPHCAPVPRLAHSGAV